MSKWLRRGFGQNNNNNTTSNTSNNNINTSVERQAPTTVSEFPTPPRNDLMPASAAVATAAYHHHQQHSPNHHHHSQQQPHHPQLPHQHHHIHSSGAAAAAAAASSPNNMAQFETAVAMDVDNTPNSSSRHKYSQQAPPSSYHPPSSSNKPYESSSRNRVSAVAVADPSSSATPAYHRSSGNRGSSRDRRSRSTFSSSAAQQQQPPLQPPQQQSRQQQSQGMMMMQGGATNAPPQQQQPPGTMMNHTQASSNNASSSQPMQGGNFGVVGAGSPPSNVMQQQPPSSQQQQQQQATTPYGMTNHHHKDPLLQSAGTPPPPDSSTMMMNMTSGAQPSFPPPAVTADSPQPSEVSQRRPAYLLHRDLVIGKGSYGQVCIASRGEPEGHSSSQQQQTTPSGGGRSGKRKKFACKCVLLRSDPKYIAKLQEEVNVLRELRGHTNVIRLYDVFCVDNELFIITELGRGGDLFHLLTTHPKHGVTEAYAAKTVSEMLSAVAFLHSRSICHRDLKLENWVLESGKDVWSPLKLIDFGLSTHFSPGQRLSRVVGSSYYVAPEVLKKSYTEACDLWSLGVIVYMLLSGAPPFYGKNDEAIKASIVQGEYTFPHELFRDVSDEAMAFVSTLLSYNIEYRYTAEQALTHPWLATNCDPEALGRAKDGARGIGIQPDLDNNNNSSSRLDPMQM